MDLAIQIMNCVVSGMFFAIWKSGDLLNFAIKMALFMVMLVNLLHIAGKV